MKLSAWTLVYAGWLVAIFHLLLVTGVIPENIAPCAQDIACSHVHIEWFGFITIPLLSVGAFSMINTLLVATYLKASK